MPVAIKLQVEEPHQIRFSFQNTGKSSVVVCRNFEYPNFLLIEKMDPKGVWRELAQVDPDMEEDPREPDSFDWLWLNVGGQVSWTLSFNRFGRLRAGDIVRVTWHTDGKPPSSLKDEGKVFPSPEFVQTVRVE